MISNKVYSTSGIIESGKGVNKHTYVILLYKNYFISTSAPGRYVHRRIRLPPDVRRRRVYLSTHRRGHWNAIVCSGKWSNWSLTSGNVTLAWARPWHPSAVGCASSLEEQSNTGTVLHETLPRNLRVDPTPT
jgi:hypothetical protein